MNVKPAFPVGIVKDTERFKMAHVYICPAFSAFDPVQPLIVIMLQDAVVLAFQFISCEN